MPLIKVSISNNGNHGSHGNGGKVVVPSDSGIFSVPILVVTLCFHGDESECYLQLSWETQCTAGASAGKLIARL